MAARRWPGLSPALTRGLTPTASYAPCREALGHEEIVADPNFAPMHATRDRRIKTDKRDARALCGACRLGAYRAAHRTSDRQRDVRDHLSVRDALIRTRSKYIVLIGALARREGCRIKAGPSPSFARRVEQAGLPAHTLAQKF